MRRLDQEEEKIVNRITSSETKMMFRRAERMSEIVRLMAAMDGRGADEDELHTDFGSDRHFAPSAQLTPAIVRYSPAHLAGYH